MTEKKVRKIVASMQPKSITYPLGSISTHPIGIAIVDTACTHAAVQRTLAGCMNTPCNTCTCMQCGKKWACY